MVLVLHSRSHSPDKVDFFKTVSHHLAIPYREMMQDSFNL